MKITTLLILLTMGINTHLMAGFGQRIEVLKDQLITFNERYKIRPIYNNAKGVTDEIELGENELGVSCDSNGVLSLHVRDKSALEMSKPSRLLDEDRLVTVLNKKSEYDGYVYKEILGFQPFTVEENEALLKYATVKGYIAGELSLRLVLALEARAAIKALKWTLYAEKIKNLAEHHNKLDDLLNYVEQRASTVVSWKKTISQAILDGIITDRETYKLFRAENLVKPKPLFSLMSNVDLAKFGLYLSGIDRNFNEKTLSENSSIRDGALTVRVTEFREAKFIEEIEPLIEDLRDSIREGNRLISVNYGILIDGVRLVMSAPACECRPNDGLYLLERTQVAHAINSALLCQGGENVIKNFLRAEKILLDPTAYSKIDVEKIISRNLAKGTSLVFLMKKINERELDDLMSALNK